MSQVSMISNLQAKTLFSLGLFAGLQIEFTEGLYSAHLVILVMLLYYVRYNKRDLILYGCFIGVCITSTMLNMLLVGNLSEFKLINLVNTIFLYSVVLVRISKEQYLAFFKGIFISFCILCLFVLSKFNLSLLSNGIFVFFVQERDWFETISFFGNTFAIYGIIVAYINYRILYKNIFLFLVIALILILTTSRMSLFGLFFVLYFATVDYFLKSIKGKIILSIIALFSIIWFADFSLTNLDNFELFSNRLEYSDDRSELSIIAKKLFLRSPVYGNGPIFIEKYTLLEPHLHNIWFDISVGYGILGVLIYFSIFFQKVFYHTVYFKDFLFVIFIFLASISQISLKAPFVGLVLFAYLNLYMPNFLMRLKGINQIDNHNGISS